MKQHEFFFEPKIGIVAIFAEEDGLLKSDLIVLKELPIEENPAH